MWENQRATQDLLAGALAERAGGGPPPMRLGVLAGAALSALTTAITTWAQRNDPKVLADLVDEAFTALVQP